MAKNDGLSQLRADIKRLQRNAGKKIYRIKSKEHLELAHTQLDPRRPGADIDKMRTRDLLAQKRRLEQFNSRETQYVPDAHGNPMSGKAWREYKAKERLYNAKTAADFAKIADVFIPNSNQTIKGRMNTVTPDRPHMANPTVNTPYRPPKRKSTQIRDAEALKKLSKDMDNRLNKNYDSKQLKESRDTWVKAASVLNDPTLSEGVAGLTPKQFGVLWGYTNFADITFLEYHLLKSQEDEEMEAWQSDVFDAKTEEARELVKWARTLDLGD